MKLIGMLDSPYVRRVAISLQCLGLPFEHQSLSVFRTYEQFRAINPVVKAPTLVCDDGTVLMDSSLILDYAEAMAAPKRLMPKDIAARCRDLRIMGLALAACEKAVSLYYERALRPAEARHMPWIERVTAQMLAAFDELEKEATSAPLPSGGSAMNQAGICTAVTWYFAQSVVGDAVPAGRFPKLAAYSATVEKLPEFRAAAHGDGTYPCA